MCLYEPDYVHESWYICEVCGRPFNMKTRDANRKEIANICDDCMDKIDEELKEGELNYE